MILTTGRRTQKMEAGASLWKAFKARGLMPSLSTWQSLSQGASELCALYGTEAAQPRWIEVALGSG